MNGLLADPLSSRGTWLSWVAVLTGPASWALNQLVGYALVKPACAAGLPHVQTALAVVMLAISLAGAGIAWTALTRLQRDDGPPQIARDRARFMAINGLGLNLLVALLIVTAAVSPFLLSPCE